MGEKDPPIAGTVLPETEPGPGRGGVADTVGASKLCCLCCRMFLDDRLSGMRDKGFANLSGHCWRGEPAITAGSTTDHVAEDDHTTQDGDHACSCASYLPVRGDSYGYSFHLDGRQIARRACAWVVFR